MTAAVVLDTCAFLDLAVGRLAGGGALDRIASARRARQAWVSAVVALEVAQKASVGKLLLPGGGTVRDWFHGAVQRLGLSTQPVTPTMALAAYDLPEPFHRDPADRLIVAAARLLQVPVVTSDRRILAYAAAGHVAAVPYRAAGTPA